MSENSETNHVGGYLAAFAIGALIGTGAALLYAPRSGKETRDLLAQKGRDLKDRASDAINTSKGFIESKKAELTVAIEAGKDAMRAEQAKHKAA